MGEWNNCWHLGIDLSKSQILYDGDNDSIMQTIEAMRIAIDGDD